MENMVGGLKNKMANTTINIPKEVREALKKSKKYNRETYSDTIKRLIRRDKRRLN